MESKDIITEITEGRKVSEDIIKAANEDILKGREENLKQEMIRTLQNSEYKIGYSKLRLKRARAFEEVEKERLTKVGENMNRLKAGGITPEDWKKEDGKIEKEASDKLLEKKAEFSGYLKQLNHIYTGCSWSVLRDSFDRY